ncbi:MAG TPA: hypothetical protein VGN72_06305 [Tepidisphaeraceae bacterium]|jgi:hypothetical protein|nr:hypothetical protein [Tepidisphaeraceae bacterium]
MQTRDSDLVRFLARVHRRATAWRIGEAVGLGIGVAAGVASALAAGLVYLQRDAWPVVGATLLAGALAGVVRGIATRPTRFETACLADRQLNLHELLSTAMTLRDHAEPWAQGVVAQADRRARSLRANDLLLQRLGARAWGGIGIATAMTLVLAALASEPAAVVAVAGRGEGSRETVTASSSDDPRQRSTATGRPTTPQREATSTDGSAITRNTDPTPTADTGGTASSTSTATPAGGQAATSSDATSASADPATARPLARREEPQGARDGTGDGLTAIAISKGESSKNGRVTDERSPTDLGSMDELPTGSRRDVTAPTPVSLESVPDRYRDVVRAYFDASAP